MTIALYINKRAALTAALNIKEPTSVRAYIQRGQMLGYRVWLNKSAFWLLEK